MVTRRQIVVTLGAGALAPFTSFAQRVAKVWRIGILWELDLARSVPRWNEFIAGMGALGYAEGRDYVIDLRSAQSDLARVVAWFTGQRGDSTTFRN